MWIKLNFGLTNLFSTQKYILDKNYFSSKEIVVPVYFQGKKIFKCNKNFRFHKVLDESGQMFPAQVMPWKVTCTNVIWNCGQNCVSKGGRPKNTTVYLKTLSK